MTLQAAQIILRPVISEKSMDETQRGKYTFAVHDDANKLQIKDAVEIAFNVRVKEVNTMMMKGKRRRYGRALTKQPDWKKAIVTLHAGEKIELFEGV